MCLWPLLLAPDTVCGSVREYDLPAFFGPVITGEQRQLNFVVRLRVLPGGSSQRSVQFWSVSMANKSSIVSDLHGWRTPSVSGEELQAPGKSGPQ